MNVTPTMKGSFLAGIGFWTLLWCAVCKIDSPARAIGLGRFISSQNILGWIRRNQGDAVLGTELVNYGSHGSSADGVFFALGGTVVNLVVIYCLIPLFHGKSKPVVSRR